jgi:uncharacterized protein YqfA (UPF0365 family)
MDAGLLILIILFVLIAVSMFLSFVPLRQLRAARSEGVRLKLSTLAGMRLRKTNQALMVTLLIKAHKAGLSLTTQMLECQYLVGGNSAKVLDSLIAAKDAGIPFEWRRAAAIDISGGDPIEFINSLAQNNRTYTHQEVEKAAGEYVENLDKDMLRAKRMVKSLR